MRLPDPKYLKVVGCVAGMVVALLGAIVPAGAAAQRFVWPHGARAAVSLAYDDALDSHLDAAIPALDKAGLKASFYLTLASDVQMRRMTEWRAAASGHSPRPAAKARLAAKTTLVLSRQISWQ